MAVLPEVRQQASRPMVNLLSLGRTSLIDNRSEYTCDPYSYNICNSAIRGKVTITVAPDGQTVKEWQTITLPNSDGDYILYGERHTEARAPAVQIRFRSSISPLSSPTIPATLGAAASPLSTTTSTPPSKGLSQATRITLYIAIPIPIVLFFIGILVGIRWRASRYSTTRTPAIPGELNGTGVRAKGFVVEAAAPRRLHEVE